MGMIMKIMWQIVITKALQFCLEKQKEDQGTGKDQRDCRKEGAQESDRIELFMNSWTHPQTTHAAYHRL